MSDILGWAEITCKDAKIIHYQSISGLSGYIILIHVNENWCVWIDRNWRPYATYDSLDKAIEEAKKHLGLD
jgi:hypothetical protein